MPFLLNEVHGEFAAVMAMLTKDKDLILVEHYRHIHKIFLEPDFLNLIDLKVNVYNGAYHLYNEEDNDYELYSNVILFYDQTTGKELSRIEDSTLHEAIRQFCNCNEAFYKYRDNTGNLRCTYSLDNGNFLYENVVSIFKPDYEIEFDDEDDLPF